MDDEELLTILKAEEQLAENSALDLRRTKIASYYEGDLSGDIASEEGRSSATSLDVLEVVETLLPHLIRRFASASQLVKLSATGPEDELAAKQETDVLNHIFWEEMDGFSLLYRWIKASLIEINSTVKTWIDEREMTEPVRYYGLTEDQLTIILNDAEIEITSYDEYTEVFTDQYGAVAELPLYNVEGTRRWKERRVRADLLLPDEYLFSSDGRHLNDTNARFRAHRAKKTVSELIQLGFPRDVAEFLPGVDETSSTALSRSEFEGFDLYSDPAEKSQELKECVEAVALVDINDDGISERIRAVYAGEHMLERDEYACRYGPFHSITPIMMPHSQIGKSPAELVLDISLIKTALQRGMLDNIYATNRPREIVVWGQLTQEGKDDIYDPGIGTKIRATNPDAIKPLTVPFVAGESFNVINYWDSIRKDRTGIGGELLGLESSQLSQVNTGVMQDAVEAVQTKIDLIARVISETGIRSLFLGIHELLRKYQDVPLRIKLRGEWAEVDPREWRERTNLQVQVGLGAFSRTSNSIALQQIVALQTQLLSAGPLAVMVTPQNVYNTMVEIVRNSGLRNPELYFTEPPEPEEMPPEEPQEDPKVQASLQIAQIHAQLEQMKAELEREKHEKDLQLQAAKTKADFEAKELEASIKEMQVRLEDGNADQDRALKEREIEGKLEIERAKLRLQAVPIMKGDEQAKKDEEMNKEIHSDLAARLDQIAKQANEQNARLKAELAKLASKPEPKAPVIPPAEKVDLEPLLRALEGLKEAIGKPKEPVSPKQMAKLYKQFEKELGK